MDGKNNSLKLFKYIANLFKSKKNHDRRKTHQPRWMYRNE
jgi:hypothetical protein